MHNAAGGLTAVGRELQRKIAPIGVTDSPLHEPLAFEPIDHTGQGRSFVQKSTMDVVDRAFRRRRQMQQHDGFRLSDFAFQRGVQIESKRMNGAVQDGDVLRKVAGPRPVDFTTLSYYRVSHEAFLVFVALVSLLGLPAKAAALQNMTKSVSFELHLRASPDAAFPLFDPVNEMRWDPQWKPRLIGDTVDEGLVFLVGEGEHRTTWLLDRYDPIGHHIAYVVSARSTLTRILINLRPEAGGCAATITYLKTALDPQALPSIEHFAKHFPLERQHWESAINAVLEPA